MSRLPLLLLLVASIAFAGEDRARELLERGLRSYAVGAYAEAIADFREGYKLDPRPDFLYALAQAQRMSGDCASAIASYRAYLRTDPPERSAAPARQNLERCEKQEAERPPPPAPLPAAVVAPAPPPDAPPPRRWSRDPAAAVLAALGGAALVAGGVLWGVGEAGVRDVAGAATYDDFARRFDGAGAAETQRAVGIAAVAVGGTLAVVAVARWALLARRYSSPSK